MHKITGIEENIFVTFDRSHVVAPWDGFDGSLLEFAELHGVEISYGCRYGDCGTCLTNLISGAVEYLHETGMEPEAGTCLPCSCRPVTSLHLDI